MIFKCDACQKEFAPTKADDVYVIWHDTIRKAGPKWYCPKCVEKWKKDFSVVEAKINPLQQGYHYTVNLKFKNNTTMLYDPINTEKDTYDVPDGTFAICSKVIAEQLALDKKQEISVRVTDNFEEQSVSAVDGNGNKWSSRFRRALDGRLQLDEKTFNKLDESFLAKLKIELEKYGF